MNLIMKQMPVVVSALNVGFLQTLKLFIVTLVGALPLGLVIAFGSMSHFKPLSWLARLIVLFHHHPRSGYVRPARGNSR